MNRKLQRIILFSVAALAQPSLPRFEDYRTTDVFKGKPAQPILRTRNDRSFRMQIREGAAKGPNFAGYLTIAQWGCGAGCVSLAVIDARNGTICPAPFDALALGSIRYADGAADTDTDFNPLEFRLDSRMLLARGCPEEKDCASYYYVWTGTALRLIRTAPPAPQK